MGIRFQNELCGVCPEPLRIPETVSGAFRKWFIILFGLLKFFGYVSFNTCRVNIIKSNIDSTLARKIMNGFSRQIIINNLLIKIVLYRYYFLIQ